MSIEDQIVEAGWREPVNSTCDENFPYVQSPLYGEISAPETPSMLLRYLECVRWSRPWLEAWRGQANIGWQLDSTAARRLRLHQAALPDELPGTNSQYGLDFEELLRNYEARLLNQARMAGHGLRGSRELTDLELLSALRHYGAATRLMDFSRNVFVALWFACSDNDHLDKYGLLVGLEGNNAKRIQTEAHLRTSIPDLIDDHEQRYWL